MGNIEKYYQAFCSKLITQQHFVITFFASPEKLLKCRLGTCGTAQPIRWKFMTILQQSACVHLYCPGLSRYCLLHQKFNATHKTGRRVLIFSTVVRRRHSRLAATGNKEQNIWWFEGVVLEICVRTDRQTRSSQYFTPLPGKK